MVAGVCNDTIQYPFNHLSLLNFKYKGRIQLYLKFHLYMYSPFFSKVENIPFIIQRRENICRNRLCSDHLLSFLNLDPQSQVPHRGSMCFGWRDGWSSGPQLKEP